MEQCTACRAEIPVYERRCQSCGAGVVRDANSLLANAPTDKELSQARLGHLLALPGMLILGVLFYTALGMFGLLGLVPLNLIIPFVYWLAQRKSRFLYGAMQQRRSTSSCCGHLQYSRCGLFHLAQKERSTWDLRLSMRWS